MVFLVKKLVILFSLLSISLVAQAQSVAQSYSAKYKILDQQGFQSEASELIFSVLDGHVVRQLPAQSIIEHWVKRDDGRHVFYRHFPSHKSSIYYNRGDLRAMNLASDWESVVEVIPVTWLNLLEHSGTRTTSFGEASVYEGNINGYEVSVEWLDGHQLPYLYSIRQQYQKLTLELESLSGSEETAALLTEWNSFRRIDFSDAMDMERDTFVQYLIATQQLEVGGASLHSH